MSSEMRLAGRYLLLERVGAGGMGEVWRAADEVLGRTVAVKMILPELLSDDGFVRRFLAEARAMASVDHPGVVAIHDFHASAGQAYLVMEYVDGEPLSRVLARQGQLPADQTMRLVAQAARALQAVHDRGIVHRDVKPANLLVRADGAVMLADFGIAFASEQTTMTGPNVILGTPSYLAPEQVLGHPASASSDIYTLGLVAYECLTGTRPFTGDTPYESAMMRVGSPPPRLPAEIPHDVAAVVARALEPHPNLRWPSASAFAAAADLAADPATYESSTTTTQVVAAGAAGRSPRRHPALVLGVAAVLAVGAGIGYVAWGRDQAPADALSGPSQSPGAGPDERGRGRADGRPPPPPGFVPCGDGAICPQTPLCWRGLVTHGDRGVPPGEERCSAPHYWETFAAGPLPSDANTDRELITLIERPDIAALCSPERMAQRSLDPDHTAGWRIEAWPIPAGPYVVLVHCLAGSPEGETPGAVFRSG